MAGTLLKLKARGYRTGVADLTRGEMGTRGTPEIRAREALDAARILGLDARVNVELADGHLALNEDTRVAVTRLFRRHRPHVVFTSHWDDPHRITPRQRGLCARQRGSQPCDVMTKQVDLKPSECPPSLMRFIHVW